MPATSTIQMTEPKAIPSSRYWRDAGTRPNSSVVAQPIAVVRILPTKREPNANRPARIAMCAASGGDGRARVARTHRAACVRVANVASPGRLRWQGCDDYEPRRADAARERPADPGAAPALRARGGARH